MNWKRWCLTFWLLASLNSYPEVVANSRLSPPPREEVVRAFTGKLKRWSTGEQVTVYILQRTHPATQRFTYDVLGISPSAFEDIHNEALANQQRLGSRMLTSESEMLRHVAATLGSVGYVSNAILINHGGGYVQVVGVR